MPYFTQPQHDPHRSDVTTNILKMESLIPKKGGKESTILLCKGGILLTDFTGRFRVNVVGLS